MKAKCVLLKIKKASFLRVELSRIGPGVYSLAWVEGVGCEEAAGRAELGSAGHRDPASAELVHGAAFPQSRVGVLSAKTNIHR